MAARRFAPTSRWSWSVLLAQFFLLTALIQPGMARAQRVDATVSIGQSFYRWSEVLQQQRRILIALPPHYEAGRQRYPVLYLLDAEEQFRHAAGIVEFLSANGKIPEIILIGITNADRNRDLTPRPFTAKQLRDDPDSGHADEFLKFLAEELAPWLDARYRTLPFRILVGHSLGGLLNLHALLSRPLAFQAHIAISPSLWWDDRAELKRAEKELPGLNGPHYLFMSWGNHENVISDPARELAAWIDGHPVTGLTFSHRFYPNDNHGTTPHRSLYDGLEGLYAGWALPYMDDEEEPVVEASTVTAHYAALSQQLGYTVEPAADAVDAVGSTLLRRKRYAAGLEVLQRNASNYPQLSYVQENLGAAFEALGRFDEALQAYRTALQLQLADQHPYGDPLGEYQRHFAEITRLRSRPAR